MLGTAKSNKIGINKSVSVNIDAKFDIVIQRSGDDIGYIVDFFPVNEGDLIDTATLWDDDFVREDIELPPKTDEVNVINEGGFVVIEVANRFVIEVDRHKDDDRYIVDILDWDGEEFFTANISIWDDVLLEEDGEDD